jgi:hypothetical protein
MNRAHQILEQIQRQYTPSYASPAKPIKKGVISQYAPHVIGGAVTGALLSKPIDLGGKLRRAADRAIDYVRGSSS